MVKRNTLMDIAVMVDILRGGILAIVMIIWAMVIVIVLADLIIHAEVDTAVLIANSIWLTS